MTSSTDMEYIPKTIHYCWFGGKKTPLAKRCIASWRRTCPEYNILEWNENNYDLNSNRFAKEAYDSKKYGFVVDPVRLDIIHKYGGIYLDCDVELIKPLDYLLKYDAFFAFQKKNMKKQQCEIALGLGFGAKPNNDIIAEYLELYKDTPFTEMVSTDREKSILVKYGLVLDGNEHLLDGNIKILDSDVLCPMGWKDKKLHISNKTCGIHWFKMSWKVA